MSDGVPRSTLVGAWLLAFGLFLAVAHGNFETTDAGFTMHAARALWVRGDSGLLREDQGGELLGERLGAAYIHHWQAQGARRSGKVGTNGRAYVWYPVGHVWLLAPLCALGDRLTQSFPGADAAFRERVAPGWPPSALASNTSWVEGHPVLTQGLISLLVPPACGASILLLLVLLARQFGARGADAFWPAVAIVVATQCFALGREQLSDGPGLVFLLGALLAVVIVHHGRGTAVTACLGGLTAAAAVLLRYQNALTVAALAAALAHACHRQRRWRDFGWFLLGGLPLLVLFLATNHARFGSVFDTGYPEAGDWFDQPVWQGGWKLLVGAGRGVLWLSPIAWFGFVLCSRRAVPALRWLAVLVLAMPWLLFSTAQGWQGGQCWGARYLTHGLVALLAIALPQARPWRRWPRLWLLACALGLSVAVTSTVAPVRGVLQLATQAVAAAGLPGDPADITGWRLRYTPLLANWRYAAACWRGDFETADGQPRNGSAHTIEALFGVAANEPGQALAPVRWEDRQGRHLWWRFWSELLGVSAAWLLLPVAGLLVVGAFLLRRASTLVAMR